MQDVDEIDTCWRMPDGQIWRVGALMRDQFETTALCVLESDENCVAHWPLDTLRKHGIKVSIWQWKPPALA